MGRALKVNECKGTCNWVATDEKLGDEELFACSACGSEWVPSQTWTPRNADGEVPTVIAQLRGTVGEQPMPTEPRPEPGTGGAASW